MTRSARSEVVAGLFAGVGGIEMGLSRSGHRTALLCEYDCGASEVLRTRFPGTRCHDDVRTLEELPDEVTLLAGGFPCQDLSQAGRTVGIAGAKSGLIGEVFRLLDCRRIPTLFLENVPFMLQLGKGEALEVIVSELERLGYQWAYRVIDSRAFGLPQRRQRVFLIASTVIDPRAVLFATDAGEPLEPSKSEWRNAACGFYWTEGLRGLGWAHDAVPTLKGGSTIGIPSPPAIVLQSGQVVKPDIRDAERMQGFPVDWTKPAEGVVRPSSRWKMVGNAVSVDAAAWVGRRLANPGEYDGPSGRVLVRERAWPKAAWNTGDGRRTFPFSAWPVHTERVPLAEFLQYEPTPLSERATAGFLKRAEKGSLRFPPGFIDTVRRHLEWTRSQV